MSGKPQTLAEQIRATYPPLMSPDQRVAWDGAISRAAALADAATPTGWVIANGNDDRWRCVWEWESNAEWTDDITQALKFATRDDAERYSKEDEDAWLIYEVGIPPTTTPVVGAEQAGDVRQAVRVRELVWTDEEYPGECWSAHPYDIWRENDGYHLLYWSITHGDPYPTLEAAQGYAYSHKVAMIKKEIEPDPTPALAEALRLPEVQAVVKCLDREKSLIWIIENTVQVLIRNLALEMLGQQRAALKAWRDGQRPPTEYEQKVAAMKKDFPNGI